MAKTKQSPVSASEVIPLFDNLRRINEELNHLRNMAELCAGVQDVPIEFTLSVTQPNDENKGGGDPLFKDTYEEVTEHIQRMLINPMHMFHYAPDLAPKQIQQSASGSLALKILAVILQEKLYERSGILSKLKELGINLSIITKNSKG